MIHKKVNQAANMDQFEIKLNVVSEMTPSTRIIVYYIQKSGEIVHDSVVLGFHRELTNHVS
jgi:Alpha-2-macroglobulin bait region domain